jgi:hypothetical protein
VSDLVLDILAQLAGEPFQLADDTLVARYAAVGKWFADAQRVGEENYILSRLFGTEDDRELKQALFWLVCENYPAWLPALYRDLLDNHLGLWRHGWQFARAVAGAPLPDSEKHKVLEYAAKHPYACHQSAGIKFLRVIDTERAHELLLATLDKKPTRWEREVAWLAWVVAENDDPREWHALAKFVRRGDVRTRIELLDGVASNTAAAGRKQGLAFLAEYLTDDAVRDLGDCRHIVWNVADRDFPQLEVRNSAAMRIARILKIDTDPEPAWTAAEWAGLRERVRTAVAKELGR